MFDGAPVGESSSSSSDSLRNTTSPDDSRPEDDVIPQEMIRTELRIILATDAFRRSEHSTRLLQNLVEYSLAGRADELKEYSLAVEALGRKTSFDPRVDPIVRVETGRLRKKLREYYESEGRTRPVRIALPLRRYVAEFSRSSAALPTALPAPDADALRVEGKLQGKKWTLVFLPVLIVILAAILWERRPASASIQPGNVGSIAVLPFADLSRNSSHELLSDALTEEVIEALSHVQGLRIISRSSSGYFKGKSGDVSEIGLRLGVKYVLEGSVNRSGARVRVIARLVNAADGYRVWSKSFVREFQDTAPVEEQMARMIVDELRQQFGRGFQRPFAERGSSNPEAYQSFQKGVNFSRRWSVEDLRKSITYFDRATTLDPGYAPAWAGLADAYILLATFAGAAPLDSFERARRAAARAIELDIGLAHAHASLAYVKAVVDWDWKTADSEFRLAHDLDPGDARIHEAWVSGYLIPLGQLNEAFKQIQEAEELDPVSVRISSAVGTTYFFRRQYDRAIDQYRKTLELDASFFPAYLGLADAYTAKGMEKDAAVAFEKWRAAAGHAPTMPATREDLLPWLEEAVRQRLPITTQLNVHPRFDSLRSDPTFRSLAKRVGLRVE
jgi:TolB-like protein/Flp pilus assembly protein TadD